MNLGAHPFVFDLDQLVAADRAAQGRAVEGCAPPASCLQPFASALLSARVPVNLIGSPINYANRLIGSLITSQSTALGCGSARAATQSPAHETLAVEGATRSGSSRMLHPRLAQPRGAAILVPSAVSQGCSY